MKEIAFWIKLAEIVNRLQYVHSDNYLYFQRHGSQKSFIFNESCRFESTDAVGNAIKLQKREKKKTSVRSGNSAAHTLYAT